ncbi:MAG: hypothetical protein KAQ75_14465, partial [Bacteroidales bacterium]|nr:hypothetical protein [Bacteroidales bacterium]
MKKIFIFPVLIVFILLSIYSNAQQIENIRIKSLSDKLNIIYDITHEKSGQLFDIKVLCSNDGGSTFNISINTASGDIGKKIEGGKDK